MSSFEADGELTTEVSRSVFQAKRTASAIQTVNNQCNGELWQECAWYSQERAKDQPC